MRNQFADPATGETYVWQANHATEELGSEERAIEELAPALAGWREKHITRQQGTRQPITMRLAGTILSPTQHEKFIYFTRVSKVRSIFFYGFDGNNYEVLINNYSPTRKFVINAPRGSHYIWSYTLEMEIITEI